MKNHYKILGLPRNASPRKIKEQYRKLAKIYHPDKLANSTDQAYCAEKFKEINEAYEALSEVVQRANLLLEQKKWSKAMIVFNEILASDSTYRDVLTCLQETRRRHKRLAAQYAEANSFFQQRKWTEAMQSFEFVLQEDPDYRDTAKKYKRARREQLMVEFMGQY
jgi:curved DNA-binding protein CbpA